jgi:hypothetical protein
MTKTFNHLKPGGYFTYHQVKHSNFYMVLTLRLSALYGFFPCITLTYWLCVTEVESVYCAVRTESFYKAVEIRL